jgi:hypothetical protein
VSTATPEAPAETAAPDSAAPDSAGHVARRRWRRSRGILVAIIALAIVGVVLAALQPRQEAGYLDPDSPGQQGAKALTEITRQNGTPVTVEHSVSAAADLMRTRPDAVLVITHSERLLPGDLSTLGGLPGDRLLIEPTGDTLEALAPGVVRAGGASGTLTPDCSLPAAVSAGDVALPDAQTYNAPAIAAKCYFSDGKPSLVQLPATGSTVTVLGTGAPLTNERLAEEGIAVLLVALWRARRLGPVVVEPLPVVVRSAEAVEGRARLYRSRRACDRAALALRTGALERLTALLGMPRSAATDPAMAAEIIAGIAAHTGQAQATIGAALYGPPPVDDTGLVRLAGYLDELERQVRNS